MFSTVQDLAVAAIPLIEWLGLDHIDGNLVKESHHWQPFNVDYRKKKERKFTSKYTIHRICVIVCVIERERERAFWKMDQKTLKDTKI